MNDDGAAFLPTLLLSLVVVGMVALGVWINGKTDVWAATFAALGL